MTGKYNFELLAIRLGQFLAGTRVDKNGCIYHIFEEIDRVDAIKFEIYSNDHDPPHLHINKKGGFKLTMEIGTWKLIKERKISKNDLKKILNFIEDPKIQKLIKEKWNEIHPDKLLPN